MRQKPLMSLKKSDASVQVHKKHEITTLNLEKSAALC